MLERWNAGMLEACLVRESDNFFIQFFNTVLPLFVNKKLLRIEKCVFIVVTFCI